MGSATDTASSADSVTCPDTSASRPGVTFLDSAFPSRDKFPGLPEQLFICQQKLANGGKAAKGGRPRDRSCLLRTRRAAARPADTCGRHGACGRAVYLGPPRVGCVASGRLLNLSESPLPPLKQRSRTSHLRIKTNGQLFIFGRTLYAA